MGEENVTNVGVRFIISVLSHPFEYAKVLIQIGYEPLPPQPGRTLFGQPALKLPNIFQYVRHIQSVDGFTGCFRGAVPKMCGNFIGAAARQRMVDYFDLENEEALEEENETEEYRTRKFLKTLKGDIIQHTTTVIVSHPFHVITIRIMGQFVGKETKYGGLFSSVGEIYRQNGIIGFFSGLVPRLIGEIFAVLLAGGLTYICNKYIIQDKQFQKFTTGVFCFFSTSVMYPFQVVSHCMAVSNSGLAIGSPPFMPHYESWVDCWGDLSQRQQLKRGSSLILRYYTGPPQFLLPTTSQISKL